MEVFSRKYTFEELELLKRRKYTVWEHFENFVKKLLLVALTFLTPFLFYDKYIEKVSPHNQLLVLAPLIIVSIVIVFYWMDKTGELRNNKQIEKEIENGEAIVLKIQTNTFYLRKEYKDLGSGYYVKINDMQTLYLQGQYYDELKFDKKFPNNNFEIIKTNLSDIGILQVRCIGQYLKAEKKLPAFTEIQFKNGKTHYDGEIINSPIEKIS